MPVGRKQKTMCSQERWCDLQNVAAPELNTTERNKDQQRIKNELRGTRTSRGSRRVERNKLRGTRLALLREQHMPRKWMSQKTD